MVFAKNKTLFLAATIIILALSKNATASENLEKLTKEDFFEEIPLGPIQNKTFLQENSTKSPSTDFDAPQKKNLLKTLLEMFKKN